MVAYFNLHKVDDRLQIMLAKYLMSETYYMFRLIQPSSDTPFINVLRE